MRTTGLTTAALTVAVVGLGAWVLIAGIIPAFSRLETDFPNYYTAGRIARSGEGVERLYDDSWFQQQIALNGINQEGKFTPFPPTTSVLFIPLSVFSPLTAMRIMTTINLALLALCTIVLTRVLRTGLLEATAFTLIAGIGLVNCFRFGQMYLAVSASMILAFYFSRRSKSLLAGAASGLLITVKYYPSIMLLFFTMKREWRSVIATVTTAAALFGLSVIILGWDIHAKFLSGVLGAHIAGSGSVLDPYAPSYQSWNSLLNRLFVFDPSANAAPFLPVPWLKTTGVIMITAGTLAAAAFSVRRAVRMGYTQSAELAFCISGILAFLLAPATATYHSLLLWLPVALLVRLLHEAELRVHAVSALALYGAIGVIPYSLFAAFDAHGILSVLAYPRLFIVLGLFLIAVDGGRRCSPRRAYSVPLPSSYAEVS